MLKCYGFDQYRLELGLRDKHLYVERYSLSLDLEILQPYKTDIARNQMEQKG